MFKLAKSGVIGFGVALGISLTTSSVLADGHDGDHGGSHWHNDRYGGPHWHGDIHSFHEHDYSHWHGGHWYHGDHNGQWGWWWLAAGMWYYYPAPVYPDPDPYSPAAVIVQPAPTTEVPPPPQNWYYCQSARKYYPYIAECPEGWKAVPATPPGVPSQ